MKFKVSVWIGALFAVVIAGLSCGTQTLLETTWSLPDYQGKPFTKLAVVGILKSQDETTAFETAVAAQFAASGVGTVPGFTFLRGETNLSQDEMENRVKSAGADGVLLFKQIAQDQSETYIPPTTYVTTGAEHPEWWKDRYWGYYTPYSYHYWGYWYPAVQVTTEPGYWEMHTTYKVETTLYRVSDGKLVWIATSDTYDPTDQVDLGTSLSGPVLKNLRQSGLIPAQK
jgi:hypothetical protein